MTNHRPTRKPKLPKVWVSFDNYGVEWASIKRERAKEGPVLNVPHQYAPVQKPRRCVWKPDEDWWKFSCDPTKVTFDKPRIYCQFCGGKIGVKS